MALKVNGVESVEKHIATRLMPVFKNGDVGNRLRYLAIGLSGNRKKVGSQGL